MAQPSTGGLGGGESDNDSDMPTGHPDDRVDGEVQDADERCTGVDDARGGISPGPGDVLQRRPHWPTRPAWIRWHLPQARHRYLRKAPVQRALLSIVAGIVITTAVFVSSASAVTLGGLTSNPLGSNDTVVVPCDPNGVSIDYGFTYDLINLRYNVSSVTVASIDAACAGQTIKVTLANETAALREVSGVVTAPSTTLTVGSPVSATAVTRASVVIHG